MFDREVEAPTPIASFFLQQALVFIFLPLVGMVLALPFSGVAISALVVPFVVSGFTGYFIQAIFLSAVKGGRWVWMIPTFSVLLNAYGWLMQAPILEALEYSFWPGPDSGEKGLLALLNIPMVASWAYVGGLFIASKRQAKSRGA